MTDYQQRWRDYRKRRNLLVFAFLGYVPIVGGLGYLSWTLLHTEDFFYVLAPSWMVFAAIASLRFHLFRCPRCGKRFFMKRLYHNLFASRCLNCKLPKYEGDDGVVAMLLSQECSLCRQQILPERQMPLSTILIEEYGMCPGCRQRVSRNTEGEDWYRTSWLSRVEAISKEDGWGWEYHLGKFRLR